jgi:hypothetical protein
MTLVDSSRRQLLPWAFRPYDTSSVRGPVHAGVACPPPSVLRVWSPSRRLTPAHASSALFHADSVCGVYLSELSPLAKLVRRPPPTATRLSLPQALALTNRNLPKLGARSSPSGYFLARVPCETSRVFSPKCPPVAPLGFSLSGVSPRTSWQDSRPASSHTLVCSSRFPA